MQFQRFAISGLALISPKKFGDDRGYFSETFRADLFRENVGDFIFVQDNQSLSVDIGTVRGLHYQLVPRAQGKLVRSIAGAILDVVVDIRNGSPTYGQHVKVELSAESGAQLWVPPGFAHGFCTLQPNTIVTYKVTEYYSQEHDRGLLWNDPDLGIEWPVDADKAVISAKDVVQPRFSELNVNFTYQK
jgi:dTDP-4-dehydrorhamnose 3,5-epimerase